MGPELQAIREKLQPAEGGQARAGRLLDSFALLQGERACVNLELIQQQLEDLDLLAGY